MKSTVVCLEFRVDTFLLFWCELQLATLGNLHISRGSVSTALGHLLDLVDDLLVSLKHLAEDDVLAIEMGGDCGGDEELEEMIRKRLDKVRDLCPF